MNKEDFRIEFEQRDVYLYVHLTGEDSFSSSLSYWRSIADKVKSLELNRVLVHENLTGNISEGEIFDVMMNILPDSNGIKVAFFDENQADHDINDLGQLIANNRGADIRIFQSLETAEKWISAED